MLVAGNGVPGTERSQFQNYRRIGWSHNCRSDNFYTSACILHPVVRHEKRSVAQ